MDSATLHPSFHCGHLHHFYFLSFMKNAAITFVHKFFFGHKILLLLHIYSWLLKIPVWTVRVHLCMGFVPIHTYYVILCTMWYEVGWVHGCGNTDACDPMDCSLPDFSSMGFSRQGYWSGLPFPLSGDFPDPGIEPVSPAAPALQVDYLLQSPGSLEPWIWRAKCKVMKQIFWWSGGLVPQPSCCSRVSSTQK